MSDKRSYVDGVFGGEPVRFGLSRKPERMQMFEAVLGGPLYDLFRRFATGHWTMRELQGVLAEAYGDATGTRSSSASFIVADVLTRNPPGIYAPFASKVLEAALFGLEPAEARFDEGDALKASA